MRALPALTLALCLFGALATVPTCAAAPADAVGPLSRRAALAAGLAAGVLALSPAR